MRLTDGWRAGGIPEDKMCNCVTGGIQGTANLSSAGAEAG